MPTVRHRWTPGDREAQRYRYVPFAVPAGAAGVTVHLDYDRTRGIVDLGLFDPDGFRGYSGGARDRFAVARDHATPGYLPGPLAAGEWRVLLGLYVVPDEGLETVVTFEVGAVGAPPPAPLPRPSARPPPRVLPAAAGRRWLAGDLHAHTVHSDGVLTVDELAGLARGAGLDFLFVTDHNTVSHHPPLAAAGRRAGVRLLPGQEVTRAEGHANCLGPAPWIDFRRSADDWLQQAEDAGALLSVNHPLRHGCGWHLPLPRRTPLAEVWHRTWDRRDDAPLRFWTSWGGVGVGGSDYHDPAAHTLGAPTTWVEAEDGDVLGALAAGRVALSAASRAPLLLRREDTLLALDAEGTRLVAPNGTSHPVRGPEEFLPGAAGPHRLIDDTGEVQALTA